jgi:PIN domain nuclease of toxin-antitoxin system
MIVVDTQAVIWLTQANSQLSKAAEQALARGRIEGSLAISDITLREIAMLVSRGRVIVSTPLEVYLEFIESLFKILPITAKVADRSVRFGPNYPNDPADRIIGATAIVHGAKLVTKDELIRASGEVDCVW